MNYTTENCRTLNAKIYFKPDIKISNIDLKKCYKIKVLYNNINFINQLRYLFTYKIETPIVIKKILAYLDMNYYKNDIEIYTELRVISNESIKMDNSRGENRILSIAKHVDLNDFVVNNYLDIGCYTGAITKAFGEYFNLMPENIHGVDIKQYMKPIDYTFSTYDKKILPYESNKFSLVTILMVLHHIDLNNLDNMLDEIYRVMAPNGVLIIREHNIEKNDLDPYLLDVLHAYHDIVLNPNLDQRWTDNFEIETNNYNPISYWSEQLLKRGFIHKSEQIIKKNIVKNPFNNIIVAYVKPDRV